MRVVRLSHASPISSRQRVRCSRGGDRRAYPARDTERRHRLHAAGETHRRPTGLDAVGGGRDRSQSRPRRLVECRRSHVVRERRFDDDLSGRDLTDAGLHCVPRPTQSTLSSSTLVRRASLDGRTAERYRASVCEPSQQFTVCGACAVDQNHISHMSYMNLILLSCSPDDERRPTPQSTSAVPR